MASEASMEIFRQLQERFESLKLEELSLKRRLKRLETLTKISSVLMMLLVVFSCQLMFSCSQSQRGSIPWSPLIPLTFIVLTIGLAITSVVTYEKGLNTEEDLKKTSFIRSMFNLTLDNATMLLNNESLQRSVERDGVSWDEYFLERLHNASESHINGYRRFNAGVNEHLICPHCVKKGEVGSKTVTRKAGVSGRKMTAAILTAGISLLATGLSGMEQTTERRCLNCGSAWKL